LTSKQAAKQKMINVFRSLGAESAILGVTEAMAVASLESQATIENSKP
jgi:hypothetical protein